MDKHSRSVPGRRLLLSLAALVCFGALALAQHPHEALVKKATVNGKYTELLTIIHMPGDKAAYGDFNDYGPYNGTEWGGYKGLPTGNWVYVYPHWYIWGKTGAGGDKLPLKKASVNGKYTELLTVIHMPGDTATYGQFNDYGLYNGTEWGGYKGLPTGNWVYVYPHWYIWGKTK